MGTHEVLFPKLVAAIRGEKVTPVAAIHGGITINFELMDATTHWIVDPSPENERRLLDFLRDMRRVGHLTRIGPNGVACEAGSTGMHWTFDVGSVLGMLKWAHGRESMALFGAALEFLKDEAGLDLRHLYNGRCILPAPRIKDEKKQAPLDGYRDVFCALIQGRKVKKPASYWGEPNAIAVATLREVDQATNGELCRTLRQAAMPILYLPILREDLPDGGFRARVERTPEAERAMGKDCCHLVEAGPSGYRWAYDWDDEIEGRAA